MQNIEPRTSLTHPLHIAEVSLGGMGKIGLTLCPGKVQSWGLTGVWARDLALDLDAIADWNAAVVVSLVEGDELERLKVPGLGDAVRDRHMEWLHLPIRDRGVPDEVFEAAWAEAGEHLRDRLRAGFNVLVHCMGGLGRAGTIASRLLVELGWKPDDAIRERAIGALLGLAVGDALGTTLEFSARDSRPRLTDIEGGGPFHLQAGEWTDDTSMALALADSLLSCDGLDEHDLMTRFVSWMDEGAYSSNGRCFDIGNTVRAAIMRFKEIEEEIAG
jgi:ADP-ribosyl-[dinitrogen reductase] hydrolase